MKKQILLAVLVAMGTQLFAQDVQSEKPKKISHGFYGASSTKLTRFNKENAIVTGVYGGWLINHKLLLGAGAYGLVTNHDGYGTNEANRQNKLKMGYAGFVAEYTFLEQKRVHVTTNMLVGFGAAINGYYDQGKSGIKDIEHFNSEDESGFFVLEPTVSIETDVTKWFRVAVGGGYRLIQSADLVGISNSQLSGATANVTLKFGLF